MLQMNGVWLGSVINSSVGDDHVTVPSGTPSFTDVGLDRQRTTTS